MVETSWEALTRWSIRILSAHKKILDSGEGGITDIIYSVDVDLKQ